MNNVIRKLCEIKGRFLYIIVYIKYFIVYQRKRSKLCCLKDKKIDVVYCWADFSDMDWLIRREACRKSYCGYEENVNVLSQVRMNELKYSIRSVEKHLQGLNKIYIVTDDQIPDFIDRSNKRIQIIDHKVIFRKHNNLPNYNSPAIESNIHNIPGLAEHYLYFNDDFFLNSHHKYSDFFTKKGIVSRLGRRVISKDLYSTADTHMQTVQNTDRLLDIEYIKQLRLVLMHRPQPMLRSLQNVYESRHYDKFENLRAIRIKRFSGIVEGLSLHNYLFSYVSYYEGLTLLKPILAEKDMYYWTNSLPANISIIEALKSRQPKMFCIQEDREIELTDKARKQFNYEFGKLFSNKSSFEK